MALHSFKAIGRPVLAQSPVLNYRYCATRNMVRLELATDVISLKIVCICSMQRHMLAIRATQ